MVGFVFVAVLSASPELTPPPLVTEVAESAPSAQPFRLSARIAVHPVVAQINAEASQTVGSSARLSVKVSRRASLRLSGFHNWVARGTSLQRRLIGAIGQDPMTPSAVMLGTGGLLGFEFVPLIDTFDTPAFAPVPYSVFIHAGMGASTARRELMTVTPAIMRTVVSVDSRFVGEFGAGLRVQLVEGILFELDVHSALYSSHIKEVSGCNLPDITAAKARVDAGMPAGAANVRSSCGLGTFTSREVTLAARDLVTNANASFVANTSVSVGVAIEL